jgi:hypothetical protein
MKRCAEAVAKENAQLNEHNEKLKEQAKLYFHAFNKAAAHIEKLEAALLSVKLTSVDFVAVTIAVEALEEKDESI